MVQAQPNKKMSEYAELLAFDAPHLTQLVHDLKNKHLLTLVADVKDKRRKTMALTSKGHATATSSYRKVTKVFHQVFMDIPESELDCYLAVLQNLVMLPPFISRKTEEATAQAPRLKDLAQHPD